MIAETARNFANTELAPYAGLLNTIKTKQYSYSKYNNTILNWTGEIDKNHKFPMEKILKIGELGFMGIAIETDYGLNTNQPKIIIFYILFS